MSYTHREKADAPANWFKAADPSIYFYKPGDDIHRTTFEYDKVDSGGIYDVVTDALGHSTKTYKNPSRESRTIFLDGSFTVSMSGEPGLAITDPEYDLPTIGEGWDGVPAGGQHVIKVGHRLESEPIVATHYLYDLQGRLTDVWQPAVDDAETISTELVRPHWHYTYDDNGNQLTQVDPKGNTTSFAYNEQNRRISRTLPPDSDGITANDTETWSYDSFGRLDVHVDFKGQSTKSIYDDSATAGGRLVEEQRFAGAVDATPDERTVYAYDALGRRATVTEFAQLDADPELDEARVEVSAYDPITGAEITTTSPEGIVHHVYNPATRER